MLTLQFPPEGRQIRRRRRVLLFDAVYVRTVTHR